MARWLLDVGIGIALMRLLDPTVAVGGGNGLNDIGALNGLTDIGGTNGLTDIN